MNKHKVILLAAIISSALGFLPELGVNTSFARFSPVHSMVGEGLFEIGTAEFKRIWSKLISLTNDKSDLLTKDREEYGWSFFNSYDSFFEEAIDILTDKESGKILRNIYDLQKKIARNSAKAEELRTEYFSAPESSWNPFITTKESIDRDLEYYKDENERFREAISKYVDILHESLVRHGISIERQQLDFMISSVSGATLTKMIVVTDSLKQVLAAIEQQMVDATDTSVCKTYASIYLVTILSLRHAQDIAIEDLNLNSKKLDRLIEQAGKNIKDAKSISNYKKDKILLNNINLNQRTIEIAQKYKSILKTYKDLILKERTNLERSIKVSRNMYNTVNNASTLISMVHQSSNDYKALFKFSMPVINEIYSAKLTKEFELISEKLNQMD